MLFYFLAWAAFFCVPALYALAMTTRGGQPFQFGRFILHFIVGGSVVAGLLIAGLFTWIMPFLDDLGGLHN